MHQNQIQQQQQQQQTAKIEIDRISVDQQMNNNAENMKLLMTCQNTLSSQLNQQQQSGNCNYNNKSVCLETALDDQVGLLDKNNKLEWTGLANDLHSKLNGTTNNSCCVIKRVANVGVNAKMVVHKQRQQQYHQHQHHHHHRHHPRRLLLKHCTSPMTTQSSTNNNNKIADKHLDHHYQQQDTTATTTTPIMTNQSVSPNPTNDYCKQECSVSRSNDYKMSCLSNNLNLKPANPLQLNSTILQYPVIIDCQSDNNVAASKTNQHRRQMHNCQLHNNNNDDKHRHCHQQRQKVASNELNQLKGPWASTGDVRSASKLQHCQHRCRHHRHQHNHNHNHHHHHHHHYYHQNQQKLDKNQNDKLLSIESTGNNLNVKNSEATISPIEKANLTGTKILLEQKSQIKTQNESIVKETIKQEICKQNSGVLQQDKRCDKKQIESTTTMDKLSNDKKRPSETASSDTNKSNNQQLASSKIISAATSIQMSNKSASKIIKRLGLIANLNNNSNNNGVNDANGQKQQQQQQHSSLISHTQNQDRPQMMIRYLGSSMQVRSEQKATKVLGVVFFTFVICWTPFFVINFAQAFVEREKLIRWIPNEMMTTFLWLGYISSTINPIIYTVFNRNFRSAFRHLLLCQSPTDRFNRSRRFRQSNGIGTFANNNGDFQLGPNHTMFNQNGSYLQNTNNNNQLKQSLNDHVNRPMSRSNHASGSMGGGDFPDFQGSNSSALVAANAAAHWARVRARNASNREAAATARSKTTTTTTTLSGDKSPFESPNVAKSKNDANNKQRKQP